MMRFKRIYRRIKWLILNINECFTWEYESCINCGKNFRICWSVKNEIWENVIGVKDGTGGSLCIDCFIVIAEKMGIYLNEDDFDFINLFYPK
jgi:hypothetical protein